MCWGGHAMRCAAGHAAARASELGGSVAISMTHTRAMAGAVAVVGQ